MSGALVVLLIVGSIWDYPISQALYDPTSGFGVFFAAFGSVPRVLAGAAAGTLLIVGRNRERTGIGVVQVVAGVGLLGATVGIFVVSLDHYADLSVIAMVGIGVLIVAGTIAATLAVSRGARRQAMLRVALVFVSVVVLEILVVNVLKVVGERPRMQLLQAEATTTFAPWWVFGNEAKDGLIDSGILVDDFKSFPSAHTSGAATLMLLTALVPLRQSLARYSSLLLWVGALWGAIVALARVIIGAHFVSDTVVGFAVTFVVMLVVYQCAFGRAGALG